MYLKMKKILCFILIAIIFISVGCSVAKPQEQAQPTRQNYKDILGVTQEEIAAIEELQAIKTTLVYGMCPSTETFYDDEGNIGGYSMLFCEWLTDLFNIEFKPTIVEWDDMHSRMQAGTIDFTGEMTSNPERLRTYYMTSAIAERSIKLFRLKTAESLNDIAKGRNPRFAFLDGSNTWSLVEPAAEYKIDVSYVNNYSEAVEKMENHEIDAFLIDGPAEEAFNIYENIEAKDFFPLVYTPVSLSTLDPKLNPIITVLQKYLDDGAIYELTKLYNEGEQEYYKHKLFSKLNDVEKEYISTHKKNNIPIPITMESDVYPTIFYNSKEKEWQGIACDTLAEIEKLTGLHFETVNKPNDPWHIIFESLKSGQNAMTAELLYSKEREGSFLWADEPYTVDKYALLSTSSHVNININQVLYSKVGLVKDSAYADVFHLWYPDHQNIKEYVDMDAAFTALEKKEIDLLMTANNLLLRETNYLENPGFKANLVFDRSYGSSFGFNKNEETLCSIVSKAQSLIDIQQRLSEHFNRCLQCRKQV